MGEKKAPAPAPRRKVMAVASFGGHFVQLCRIMRPLEAKYDVVYVSTAREAKSSDNTEIFYTMDDFSRTNPWLVIKDFLRCRAIIKKERPDALISTGAAPGLTAILAARSKGVRTLWIDSIANCQNLSMCGRIARRLATKTLTQWEHLKDDSVDYGGNVLG